ncbi:translation initiation factor IF-2 subunit beta [Ignisphaera sp. 4213-co]|uniref:Translation initiation factor IF-2 subunit beta n=1 Tax=Ignisphaera cupida TaxID=3050454 RepID=A0ABD4Z617_9CREN|nr:translation initiation factor IF-2 subunit beta [Ignisphaera sp. 4213-co]MDK6028350.1 translation initiation factor IF-2 subunit beta [Ignisphaera sp. 4213-co]
MYDYEKLLNMVYERLPKRVVARAYDIPSLEVDYVGDHTVIKNFNVVCERIRREPRIVMRFLLKELAMPGSLNPDNSLIIYKRVSTKSIQGLYTRFLESYVRCSTCGSYDTELVREGKVWFIKCLACGAITYVKPV